VAECLQVMKPQAHWTIASANPSDITHKSDPVSHLLCKYRRDVECRPPETFKYRFALGTSFRTGAAVAIQPVVICTALREPLPTGSLDKVVSAIPLNERWLRAGEHFPFCRTYIFLLLFVILIGSGYRNSFRSTYS
jgi:hypothetical protein